MTGPSDDGPVEFADVAAGLTVPPSLQPSIARHRAHLRQLAASLSAAGLPDAQIKASLDMLAASYRSEWIRTLPTLQRPDQHA